MKLTPIFYLALFSLTNLLSVAAAEPVPIAEQTSPFFILDRPAVESAVGFDTSLVMVEDLRLFRIEPHLEYMVNDKIGMLAAFPLTLLLPSSGRDAIFAHGAPDLGGFVIVTQRPDLDIIARGSLSLPLASGSAFLFPDDKLLVNINALSARIGDASLVLPDSLILRSGLSVIKRHGLLTFRVDGLIDAPLYESNMESLERPLGHISAGVAYGARGKTQFVGEVVNLFSFNADDTGLLHQISAGISQRVGNGTLRFGLSTLANTLLDDKGKVLTLSADFAAHY